MTNPRICSVEGCNKPFLRKGYCRLHYMRFYRHGSPFGGQIRNAWKEYLELVVLSHKGAACLLWPFTRNNRGYAVAIEKGKKIIISRVVCERTHGNPPTTKHQAAHRCGRGKDGCVAPAHLHWATPKENEHEKVEHGTYGIRACKLTAESVLAIRDSTKCQTDLAEQYGVSIPTINDIIHRRTWRHL